MKFNLLFLFLLFVFPGMAQIPSGTDVFMATCRISKNRCEFATPTNISNRVGYDNQPAFSADGKKIYYVSIHEDGQADVYAYQIASKQTIQLTHTAESEYSPKFFGNDGNFKVVRVEQDSAQLFWNYNEQGEALHPICKSIDSIGYYTQIDAKRFAFFKITALPSLWLFDAEQCHEKFVVSGVGRSIHALNEEFVYFTKTIDSTRWIMKYDVKTETMVPIVACIKGSEDFALLGEDWFCMSSGSKLFSYSKNLDKSWKEQVDFASKNIHNIKRLTFNKSKNLISFVNDFNPN